MHNIKIPKAFKELFDPSRYKAYFGGRGSAKSHSVATALVLRSTQDPLRVLCCREIQKSIKDSVKRLIEDKIIECGLSSFFEITDTEIRGKNGTLFLFAGLKNNPDSIKSMEGIDIAWVEEASRLSKRSLELLLPTIRKENSEIWFTWNPENEDDPVDKMFRSDVTPPSSIIREVNYSDNPFFPDVLKQELEFDQKNHPQKFLHVWAGGYVISSEGAYYAKQVEQAKAENRITTIPIEQSIPVETFWDLGVGDSTAIWFVQTVGHEIRIIDCFEDQGEGLTYYAKVLQQKGYLYGRHYAPPDIEVRELSDGQSRLMKAKQMGIHFQIVPKLSVDDGINAVRSIFNQCWFDADRCHEGLKALKHYQKEFDEKRNTFKSFPLHDWSSHYADAFRYFAVGYQKMITPQPVFVEPFDPFSPI